MNETATTKQTWTVGGVFMPIVVCGFLGIELHCNGEDSDLMVRYTDNRDKALEDEARAKAQAICDALNAAPAMRAALENIGMWADMTAEDRHTTKATVIETLAQIEEAARKALAAGAQP